jgi:hypothetical protein
MTILSFDSHAMTPVVVAIVYLFFYLCIGIAAMVFSLVFLSKVSM